MGYEEEEVFQTKGKINFLSQQKILVLSTYKLANPRSCKGNIMRYGKTGLLDGMEKMQQACHPTTLQFTCFLLSTISFYPTMLTCPPDSACIYTLRKQLLRREG